MQNIKTQLPMIATYGRMLASLPLIAMMWAGKPYSVWPAAILFALASLTDWLDGYWARKYNCESSMGKLMDPIADKILVLAALVMLLENSVLPGALVFMLVARDIFIGGLRSVAATNNVIISAKPFGKWKTGFQMVGIPCLILAPVESIFTLPLGLVGLCFIWISLFLSLASAIQYTHGYYTGRKAS